MRGWPKENPTDDLSSPSPLMSYIRKAPEEVVSSVAQKYRELAPLSCPMRGWSSCWEAAVLTRLLAPAGQR